LAYKTVTKAMMRDTLRRAKEILLNEGWVKHALLKHNRDGTVQGYCLSGAIGKASGGMGEKGQLRESRENERRLWDKCLSEVSTTLGKDDYMSSIPSWNDASPRKRDDVIELLDKTMARLTPKRRTRKAIPTESKQPVASK